MVPFFIRPLVDHMQCNIVILLFIIIFVRFYYFSFGVFFSFFVLLFILPFSRITHTTYQYQFSIHTHAPLVFCLCHAARLISLYNWDNTRDAYSISLHVTCGQAVVFFSLSFRFLHFFSCIFLVEPRYVSHETRDSMHRMCVSACVVKA